LTSNTVVYEIISNLNIQWLYYLSSSSIISWGIKATLKNAAFGIGKLRVRKGSNVIETLLQVRQFTVDFN